MPGDALLPENPCSTSVPSNPDAATGDPHQPGAGRLSHMANRHHGNTLRRRRVARPSWFNVSAQGAVNAHESLRKVLGYATAEIIEDASAEVAVTHPMVGDDGLIADEHSVLSLPGSSRTLPGMSAAW